MIKISVGRFGEDLHEFTLDGIKKGAVRDSGLFPELYERKWPAVTTGVLVSGVERKFEEHRLALEAYDFPLVHPAALLPQAHEDSKEEEPNQSAIARSKLYRGFLKPLFNHAAASGAGVQKDFHYAAVAARARVSDLRHLVAIADDRSLRMDRIFLEHLYGPLRDHPNEQVQEIFEPGHDVPGQRVKETDAARLGVLNSVYLWHQAAERLRAQRIMYKEKQYLDTVLCFVPVLPGALPLPEQGLIVKAEGHPRLLRDVTAEDIRRSNEGRILIYDHFDRVSFPGLPDWMTLHDCKRAIADDQMDKERRNYSGIDKSAVRAYLQEVHSPGAAMTAFAHMAGLPGISPEPKSRRPVSLAKPRPRTVWTNANFLTKQPDAEKVCEVLNLQKGINLSKMTGGLEHLRNIEQAVYSGQAFAILDPENFPVTGRKAESIKFLREIETSLIYAYLITMSTQHGALNHIGRPHLVEKSWYKKWGLWHPDLCNLGLTGDAEREAYWLWEDADGLKEGLRQHYDELFYNHNVQMPSNGFLSETQIKETLGIQNLGFVIANYSSASGFAAETYINPFRLNYELSRWNNVTTVDGGGVRSGMLGLREGTLAALNEGYRVRNIGIRSEGDVSPLEGDIVDWIRQKGYTPSDASPQARHLHFADGQMHILRFQRILPRQAAIAALADVATISDGGKGTVVEFFIMALHNARVNLTGKGLFGDDFKSNSRVTPIAVLNREIEFTGVKRGIFDRLLEPWKDHFEIMGVHEFRGVDPVPQVVQWIRDYGRMRGFDLSDQRPNTEPSMEPS